jgi:hypothetical protein
MLIGGRSPPIKPLDNKRRSTAPDDNRTRDLRRVADRSQEERA